ncbi:MAG: AAA family ATPase, partial [Acidimicrobiia bacterium]
LDADELRGYMTRHSSGVKVLAAPFEPQLAETISGGAVQRILRVLRDSFPYVVVDGPASLNEHVLAALDETDECILMTSLDVPSIKNVKVSLQTLEQLGIGRNRIRLVMNRADSKVGLNLSEVEKSLGTHIDVAVPSSRDVPLSVNQGTPLAIQNKRSPVIGAVAKLADMVVAESSKSSAKRFWGSR